MQFSTVYYAMQALFSLLTLLRAPLDILPMLVCPCRILVTSFQMNASVEAGTKVSSLGSSILEVVRYLKKPPLP
jgi:hypothetical protein